MPRPSVTSAGATCLNRDARISALRAAATRSAERLSAVRRIILFGSLTSGRPTPRSDTDLLVVVGSSEHGEPRARIPAVLRALSPLPCPVDLFVLTEAEVARFQSEGSRFLAMIMDSGMDLL
jgi:predicted nucleotidyltransferase